MGTTHYLPDRLTHGWMLVGLRTDPKDDKMVLAPLSPVVSSACRSPLGDEGQRIKDESRAEERKMCLIMLRRIVGPPVAFC